MKLLTTAPKPKRDRGLGVGCRADSPGERMDGWMDGRIVEQVVAQVGDL